MKLHFLGQTRAFPCAYRRRGVARQAYSSSNRQVDTVASKHSAHFLGQSYIPRRPITTSKSQLGPRKYRGIAYGD